MVAKRFFWLIGFVFAVSLLTFSQGWAQMQPKPGTKAPVITNSYAIEKGGFGNVLRIYIEADDPDNDLLRIATVIEHAGFGRYPTDWVFLKPQYRGHFVGYLQWNTYNSGGLSEWTQITIKVSVFDKAGNESNVVVFPYEFVSRLTSNPPPPAPFNVANLPMLGHVTVSLEDPSRMGADSDRPTD